MIYPSLPALWRHGRDLRRWRRELGHRQRQVVAGGRGVELVEYEVSVPLPLKGMRLLLLSDLHWTEKTGLDAEIVRLADQVDPDWVICGGDLVSYSCFLKSAAALLKKLPARCGKLCVPGNWDRKRWKWFSREKWRQMLADAGFLFLCNQAHEAADGLRFWGTDDLRLGNPYFEPAAERPAFQVVIAHNPDTVIELEKHLDGIDLILCGHTHGGQVRVPGLGPLYTSSIYWRKFDYGRFRNERTGTQLLVTSGLGSSSINIRLGCPREMVLIRFR